MVYTGDKIKTIPVEEVAYFFAEGKYCYLISTDKTEYLIDQTLDKLEDLLDPDSFFRINITSNFDYIRATSSRRAAVITVSGQGQNQD